MSLQKVCVLGFRNEHIDSHLLNSIYFMILIFSKTVASTISTDSVLATLPDSDLDPDGTTRTAATITAAILGFKVMGPFGALAGATFANHYGEIDTSKLFSSWQFLNSFSVPFMIVVLCLSLIVSDINTNAFYPS